LGAMLTTLLGYPDHPYGWGEVGYMDNGRFRCVTTPAELDQKTIRPKEAKLLEIVKQEKAAGRQVWVYVQMTGKRDVLARLEKLLAVEGNNVKVLRASVPLEQR